MAIYIVALLLMAFSIVENFIEKDNTANNCLMLVITILLFRITLTVCGI